MSELRATTISDLAGTGPVTLKKQSASKAWVNFNGTFNGTGTIAARDSENVSSLTDNGTGDYTISFSNAFGAADFSAVATTAYTHFVVNMIAVLNLSANDYVQVNFNYDNNPSTLWEYDHNYFTGYLLG